MLVVQICALRLWSDEKATHAPTEDQAGPMSTALLLVSLSTVPVSRWTR
jgi:hypothetical protein